MEHTDKRLEHWKQHLEENKFLLLLITDEEIPSLFGDFTINNVTYNPICKGFKIQFHNENSEKIYIIQQTATGVEYVWNLLSNNKSESFLTPIYTSRQIKSEETLMLLNEFNWYKYSSLM